MIFKVTLSDVDVKGARGPRCKDMSIHVIYEVILSNIVYPTSLEIIWP